MSDLTAYVVSLHASSAHRFSKPCQDVIRLVEGLGVEVDAHFGATVQHRSRVRRDPSQPNLRQVHLIHAELRDELGCRNCRWRLLVSGQRLNARTGVAT